MDSGQTHAAMTVCDAENESQFMSASQGSDVGGWLTAMLFV